MESTASELFALLVLVYLVECFRWVARGAVVVRDVPPLAPWATSPIRLGAQFRRALAFGWPLPPFGSMYVADGWLASPGPTAVRFGPVEAPRGTTPLAGERVVPWEDVPNLRVDGVELRLGSEVLRVFGSRRAARGCLEALQALANTSAKKRPAAIEAALRSRYDAMTVQARLGPWRRWRLAVFAANGLLWVALFGGWALLALDESPPPLVPLLVGMLLAWLLAVPVTVLAVRRVLPREVWPTPFQWTLTLLSPLALLRSPDVVETELLGELEPAALVAALLPPKEARRWLERAAREWRHVVTPPGAQVAAAEVLADDAWLRERLAQETKRLADSLPGASEPPPRVAHCPRCLTEYGARVSECSSCPGVALVQESASGG
jgi:hypothetical protein